MKLETDPFYCEFIPETEEEIKLTKALYESLSDEDKEAKVFGYDIVSINEKGDLHIITYV